MKSKSVLAFLLAFVLILTAMPITGSAADAETYSLGDLLSDEQYHINVIKGYPDTYDFMCSLRDGRADIADNNLGKTDVLVGISVAGGAAYVVGALREAKDRGAVTVALTSNFDTPISKESDITIVTDTGAEAIMGSTRMKAGSAHKMVLNMLTTCAMVKTGKIYENVKYRCRPR